MTLLTERNVQQNQAQGSPSAHRGASLSLVLLEVSKKEKIKRASKAQEDGTKQSLLLLFEPLGVAILSSVLKQLISMASSLIYKTVLRASLTHRLPKIPKGEQERGT